MYQTHIWRYGCALEAVSPSACICEKLVVGFAASAPPPMSCMGCDGRHGWKQQGAYYRSKASIWLTYWLHYIHHEEVAKSSRPAAGRGTRQGLSSLNQALFLLSARKRDQLSVSWRGLGIVCCWQGSVSSQWTAWANALLTFLGYKCDSTYRWMKQKNWKVQKLKPKSNLKFN